MEEYFDWPPRSVQDETTYEKVGCVWAALLYNMGSTKWETVSSYQFPTHYEFGGKGESRYRRLILFEDKEAAKAFVEQSNSSTMPQPKFIAYDDPAIGTAFQDSKGRTWDERKLQALIDAVDLTHEAEVAMQGAKTLFWNQSK